MRGQLFLAVAAASLVLGCKAKRVTDRGDVARAGSAASTGGAPAALAFDPAMWRPPADSTMPTDSLGAAIRRGQALVLHTADSLPYYAPGKISCGNCHLDGGRNPTAAPFAGSQARFPKYMDRTGAVITLADRVNYCFTRSLGGNRIPVDSREMEDILAYIAWLSNGVPVGHGKQLPGADGILEMQQKLVGDSARGAKVFADKCVLCHDSTGQGKPAYPALWGARSFSVGASMARRGKAASFIWHNMPFGQGQSLTPQDAFDVAAFVDAHPRLDSPGKGDDWPNGGTPADVPYATKGHAAYMPPPVIARPNAREALVPPPASVARRARERR